MARSSRAIDSLIRPPRIKDRGYHNQSSRFFQSCLSHTGGLLYTFYFILSTSSLCVDARRFVAGARDVLDIRPRIGVRLPVGPGLAAEFEDAIAQTPQKCAVV